MEHSKNFLHLLKRRPVFSIIAGVLIIVIVVVASLTIAAFKGRPLAITPTTNGVPDFQANATAVPGWQRQSFKQVFGNYVVYNNESTSCALLTTTILFNQSEHGKGDGAVSQAALKFQLGATDAELGDRHSVHVKVVQGGSLEFLTAHRAQSSTSIWAAVRSIDTLKPVPVKYLKTVPEALQKKYGKALPTLVAQYQCPAGKGSLAEFNQLLAALSVNLR